MNRDWVRIFSMKSNDGILSFIPPNGAFSMFTNPLRRRTHRLFYFLGVREKNEEEKE